MLSAAMSCSDFSTNQIGSWICPDGTHRVMSNTNFLLFQKQAKTSSGLSNCSSRDATQVTVIYDLIQEILVLLKIDSTGLKLTRNEDIG